MLVVVLPLLASAVLPLAASVLPWRTSQEVALVLRLAGPHPLIAYVVVSRTDWGLRRASSSAARTRPEAVQIYTSLCGGPVLQQQEHGPDLYSSTSRHTFVLSFH